MKYLKKRFLFQSLVISVFIVFYILGCTIFTSEASVYYVKSGGSATITCGGSDETSGKVRQTIYYYRSGSSSRSSYSLSHSQGSLIDSDTSDKDSKFWEYHFPRSKATTIYPGGCGSADIYKECTYSKWYDRYGSPKYTYDYSLTGEIVVKNVTGTVEMEIKDGYGYYNDEIIYVCTCPSSAKTTGGAKRSNATCTAPATYYYKC